MTARNIEWQFFVAFQIVFFTPSGNLSFDTLTFPLGESNSPLLFTHSR